MPGRQPRADNVSLWVGHAPLITKANNFIKAADFSGLSQFLIDNRIEFGNFFGACEVGIEAAGYGPDGNALPSKVRIEPLYTPNDMHDSEPITVGPGDTVAIPVDGPASVSGAFPEGSGGQMYLSQTPGVFGSDEAKVSVGRGLLVQLHEAGRWFANVKLLPNMTSAAPLTFNAGQLKG